MQKYILLVSGNHDFVLSNLWILSQTAFQQQLLIILPANEKHYHSELGSHLLNTYQYFAFQNKGYQSHEFTCPVEILELKNEPLDTYFNESLEHSIVISPDELVFHHGGLDGVDDVEIRLSKTQDQLLEYVQTLGLEIDETVLEQAHQTLNQNQWLKKEKKLELFSQVCKQWLNTSNDQWSSKWHSDAGQLYRCLLDMENVIPHHQNYSRDYLKQAIKKIYGNSQDWSAHMLLWLYKRTYFELEEQLEHAPEEFKQMASQLNSLRTQQLNIYRQPKHFKVHFFLTTYNRLNWLKRCLNGFLNQTYPHWQLHLINHGSTDGTHAYIQELIKSEPRITYIHLEENQGVEAVGGFWQDFCKRIDGDIVSFIGDDDWLLPTHLEKNIQLFKEYPWIGMSYGSYQLVDENEVPGTRYGPLYSKKGLINPKLELQRAMWAGICPQTFIIRKEILREVAKIDHYVPPGGEYAVFDFLMGIRAPILSEVAYEPSVLSCLTSSTQSAYGKHDINYELVTLARRVIEGYSLMYGENTFPKSIATNMLKAYLNQSLNILKHEIESMEDDKALQKCLEYKIKTWQAYIEVKNHDLNLCSETHAPILEQYDIYSVATE